MRSLYGAWPLTAFMEVKNKYAHVIMQQICNKFKKYFFVGCMVSQPNRLLQRSTTMSLMNKIPWSMWLVSLKGNYFRGKRIWYESKEGKSLVVCPSSIVVFPPISFSYHLP